MQDANDIPTDLDRCRKRIAEQAAVNSQQAETIAALKIELEKLRKLIDRLIQPKRSEKVVLDDPAQARLPFETPEELSAAAAEAKAQAEAIVQTYTVQRTLGKKPSREESFPSHLRREEKVVEADASLTICPEHGPRKLIGYSQTETLQYTRPELWVQVAKYPKYACPEAPQCGVGSPPRPTGLTEGNRFDVSVAAAIVEAKWFHYLPIYRQQDVFAGSGWTPSRSTLLNLVDRVEFVVSPLVEHMTNRVRQDIGVGLDDTSCRLLIPKTAAPIVGGDPKSRRLAQRIAEARAKGQDSLLASMWAYSGLFLAPYNIFDFRVSRHRDGPDEFFRSSCCIVQGDCFSGNASVVIRSDGRLRLAACWAHARRKVFESSARPQTAKPLLAMIQALYDVQTRAKDVSWQQRQALRQRESTVVLAAIRNWLDNPVLDAVLPKSDFGEALRYLRNHWEALSVFVGDGRIPLDNNAVEQLMKQVALGRKAWLFVGSVAAGEQSAKMMTLVSSARRHDLDVAAYLTDILAQLLAGCTDYSALLPDVWKQTHPEAVRQYRATERRDRAERKQVRAARRRLIALQAHA